MRKFELTDEQILEAFRGTNFGQSINKNAERQRALLVQHVLKRVAGYCSGYTLTQISMRLGLTTPRDTPTKNGKRFMFDALYRREDSF